MACIIVAEIKFNKLRMEIAAQRGDNEAIRGTVQRDLPISPVYKAAVEAEHRGGMSVNEVVDIVAAPLRQADPQDDLRIHP